MAFELLPARPSDKTLAKNLKNIILFNYRNKKWERRKIRNSRTAHARRKK